MARVGISDQYAPGSIIDIQTLDGLESTYLLPTAGVWTNMTRSAAGALFQMTYTPPVNVWWDTGAKAYAYKSDAIYGYVYVRLSLSPADLDGQALEQHIMAGMHSGVVTYATVPVTRIWKLNAGTTYTLTQQVYTSTANMNFYRAAGYTQMTAKAIVR